jgi:hypothetical protein
MDLQHKVLVVAVLFAERTKKSAVYSRLERIRPVSYVPGDIGKFLP